MKQIQNFLYSALLVLLTAYVSSFFTQQGLSTWYGEVDKPVIVPVDIVFSIVWSILYGLMIVAFSRVLSHRKHEHFLQAKSLFISQLVLQMIWCFLFFSKQEVVFALIVLIYLDFVVYKMLRVFKMINKTSFYIMIPYFMWLLYATILNAFYIK